MGKAKKSKPSLFVKKKLVHNNISSCKYAISYMPGKPPVKKISGVDFVDAGISRIVLSADQEQGDLGENSLSTLQESTTKLETVNLSDSDSDEEEAVFPYQRSFGITKADEHAFNFYKKYNLAPQKTWATEILDTLPPNIRLLPISSDLLLLHDIYPNVKKVYEDLGDALRTFYSGKLPKELKIIPTLNNWEQMLYITEPWKWTSYAVFRVTKLFALTVKDEILQRFYRFVLLPHIHNQVFEHRQLDAYLNAALNKALIRPGEFIKGILVPLLERGVCSLHEAKIVSAAITRTTIPIEYSSEAIVKILAMDYSPANSIFLNVFLDKKDVLPNYIIDAVVSHFLQPFMVSRTLIFFQEALLTFLRQYGNHESISKIQAQRLSRLRVRN